MSDIHTSSFDQLPFDNFLTASKMADGAFMQYPQYVKRNNETERKKKMKIISGDVIQSLNPGKVWHRAPASSCHKSIIFFTIIYNAWQRGICFK